MSQIKVELQACYGTDREISEDIKPKAKSRIYNILKKEDAIRIEVLPGFRKDRNSSERKLKYIYKCLDCPSEIGLFSNQIKKSTGRCRKCSYVAKRGRKAWNSNKKRSDIVGSKHPGWKGGQYISSDGYKYIKVRDRFDLGQNPKWKVYKKEHIHVMEQFLGRELNKGEIVHHIDKNKLNSNLENLFLTNQSKHREAHNSLELLAIELYRQGLISFNRDSGIYEFTQEMKTLCKLD